MDGEVYAVLIETGTFSEYRMRLESIWASDADAVQHIVRDLGFEYNPSKSSWKWTLPEPNPNDYARWRDDPEYQDAWYQWSWNEPTEALIERRPLRSMETINAIDWDIQEIHLEYCNDEEDNACITLKSKNSISIAQSKKLLEHKNYRLILIPQESGVGDGDCCGRPPKIFEEDER